MSTEVAVLQEKFDGLHELVVKQFDMSRALIDEKFMHIDKRFSITSTEISQFAKILMEQKTEVRLMEKNVQGIEKAISSINATKKILMWGVGCIATVWIAFMTFSVNVIRGEAEKYVEKTTEELLDSRDFKSRVISIVDNEFFEQ